MNRTDFPRRLSAGPLPVYRWPSIGWMTAAVFALGILWRMYRYALGMPFWGDESFVAANFLRRDYAGMIEPLIYGQIVPLGYMWITLAVSRVGGLSEYALRLPALVAGLAALTIYWRLAHRVLPRRATLLAVAFFACSYWVVRHTAEVKPYAFDSLMSVAVLLLAWRVIERPHAPWRWAGLTLVATVAVWLSYPIVFVAGAAGLTLAFVLWSRRDAKALPGLLIFGLLLAGSFLAMYLLYAKPHAEAASRLTEINLWARTFPPLDRPWLLPVWFIYIHTSYLFAHPQGADMGGSTATFVLFVIGAVYLYRVRRPLFWLMVLPFVLNMAAAAAQAYPYGGSPRIAQHLAPCICLVAGLGTFVLLRRLWGGRELHQAFGVVMLLLALIPIGTMISSTIEPYQSIEVKRSYDAVRAVADDTQPGDRWIIFNADRPVDYAPFLGDWRGVGGQFVFDAARFAPVPLTWSPPPGEVEPPTDGRVWLLVYYAEHTEEDKRIAFPDDQLAAYLEALRPRLGEPQERIYAIKGPGRKNERLHAYVFDPQ